MAPRSELTPALRERICELYDAAKWGYKRIQKGCPLISVSTVRYTIKKDRERLGGVSKPRSGRPRKLDKADQEKLSANMPHRVEAIIESQGWYTPY
jgi:transposase